LGDLGSFFIGSSPALKSHRLPDALFPAGQTRILRLLVERVDLSSHGIEVRLQAEGLQMLDPSRRIFN
jgi:hypothetical protein